MMCLEELSPELAESEDEKIRKEITDLLYYYHGKLPCFPVPSISLEDTLAWLENILENQINNIIIN